MVLPPWWQELVSCAGLGGCNGGWYGQAFTWMKDKGDASQGQGPNSVDLEHVQHMRRLLTRVQNVFPPCPTQSVMNVPIWVHH